MAWQAMRYWFGAWRQRRATTASNLSWRRRFVWLINDRQVLGGRFALLSRLKFIGDLLPFAKRS